MKPRPKAPYHHGPCFHIAADPLDLSLCGDCLAFLIRDAAGREVWQPKAIHQWAGRREPTEAVRWQDVIVHRTPPEG